VIDDTFVSFPMMIYRLHYLY